MKTNTTQHATQFSALAYILGATGTINDDFLIIHAPEDDTRAIQRTIMAATTNEARTANDLVNLIADGGETYMYKLGARSDQYHYLWVWLNADYNTVRVYAHIQGDD